MIRAAEKSLGLQSASWRHRRADNVGFSRETVRLQVPKEPGLQFESTPFPFP